MALVQNRTVYRAEKTLAEIHRVITADQGNSFRRFLQQVLPHIGDAYREEGDGFRTHLGASLIGGECGRSLWYGFRWFKKVKFDARLIRLFNRGHLEEARFIAMLLAIGVQVYQQDENGNQFRISELGGHFGGSGDGVGIGIPDVGPDTPVLLEFKTHNDNSFKKLVSEGVRSAKFEHFVQMQTYMRKMSLGVALYMAVNKNNDELWAEIIFLDSELADQFIERGRTIVMLREAPEKISKSPGWITCKWCDFKDVCHLGGAPARNCRTCVHSLPHEDGTWECVSPEVRAQADSQGWEDPILLNKEDQMKGCKDHTPF